MIFGDVDVEETKELVEQYWGDWEQGENYQIEIFVNSLYSVNIIFLILASILVKKL